MSLDKFKTLPPAKPLRWSEQMPSVEACCERLMPYLFELRNRGFPGLAERDRDDVSNLVWDLDRALDRRTK